VKAAGSVERLVLACVPRARRELAAALLREAENLGGWHRLAWLWGLVPLTIGGWIAGGVARFAHCAPWESPMRRGVRGGLTLGASTAVVVRVAVFANGSSLFGRSWLAAGQFGIAFVVLCFWHRRFEVGAGVVLGVLAIDITDRSKFWFVVVAVLLMVAWSHVPSSRGPREVAVSASITVGVLFIWVAVQIQIAFVARMGYPGYDRLIHDLMVAAAWAATAGFLAAIISEPRFQLRQRRAANAAQ